MPTDPSFRYAGFAAPNYTPVPDDIFDVIAPRLSEAELRVLLYIVRRTFGFKKQADRISLNQMIEGITTGDGRRLDEGTGMSRQGVMRGIKGLLEKQIVTVQKAVSEDGVNQINVYALRFREEGVVYDVDYGSQRRGLGVVTQVDPQETVKQETDEQKTGFEFSNGHDPDFDRVRSVLVDYVADFAREFNDRASLTASTTRTLALYRRSGLGLEAFVDALYEARTITKERSAAIRAAPVGEGAMPTKPKMAYFFAVLEDLLGRPRPECRTRGSGRDIS